MGGQIIQTISINDYSGETPEEYIYPYLPILLRVLVVKLHNDDRCGSWTTSTLFIIFELPTEPVFSLQGTKPRRKCAPHFFSNLF